ALHASQSVAREACEDEVQRLRRSDEDVRRLALVARALARRRIARPYRDGGLAVLDAQTLRLPHDPDERLAQVALDVDGEGLQRRDVQDPGPRLRRCRRELQAIDRGEERRESLSGAG